jgi:hypothetical protein
MGTLSYGRANNSAQFDDRTLTHLQLVIAAKLRRGESFFFTWQPTPLTGSGHSSIWISSAIPLVFQYAAVSHPPINREWLERLTLSANGANGLHLVAEPQASAPAESAPESAPRSEPAATRGTARPAAQRTPAMAAHQR